MAADAGLTDFRIRFAEKKDVPLILRFIKELAEYEKMLDEVKATEADLAKYLFERKNAEVILGEYQDQPVAFALFFHNFSTFLGKPGIYLEDLYVKPEMRGMGIGKAMLSFLAGLAVERDCGRLEWSCLDWNEPSIGFYKHLERGRWMNGRCTGCREKACAGWPGKGADPFRAKPIKGRPLFCAYKPPVHGWAARTMDPQANAPAPFYFSGDKDRP